MIYNERLKEYLEANSGAPIKSEDHRGALDLALEKLPLLSENKNGIYERVLIQDSGKGGLENNVTSIDFISLSGDFILNVSYQRKNQTTNAKKKNAKRRALRAASRILERDYGEKFKMYLAYCKPSEGINLKEVFQKSSLQEKAPRDLQDFVDSDCS